MSHVDPKNDEDPWLTTVEVAALLKLKDASAVRSLVARKYLPPADDQDGDPDLPPNRRQKRWRTSTIECFRENRPGRGARTDLEFYHVYRRPRRPL